MFTASLKRLVSAPAIALGLVLSTAGATFAADNYKVDGVHSAVLFRIKHMGVGEFYGRFDDAAGTITTDDADPTKDSFNVEIQVKNVDTANKKRDQHLMSPDFFNAVQFPTLSFKSTSVKKTGDDTLEVTGDLTIHGVTKSVTATVTHIGTGPGMQGEVRSGYETTFDIKRSDFGMTNMIPGAGDDVRLIVSLEGIKQ